MGAIMNRTPGGWLRVEYTALYRECISKGHRPHVHGTNFKSVHLFCKDCQRFWRIQLSFLEWMPLGEWRGRPPE